MLGFEKLSVYVKGKSVSYKLEKKNNNKKINTVIVFASAKYWAQLLLGLMYLDNIFIGKRLVGLVVFGVLQQHLVHVRAGVLIQLIAAAEDDEGDLAVAQN